ncbi:MAG: glycosyltransferase family 4 protein [Elusimicrobiota bacterium]
MDRRPVVLHLITKLEFGGAQQNTLYTVGHLDPARFDVILASGPGGMLDAQALQLPKHVKVFWLKHLRREIHPLQDALAIAEIHALIRRTDPDIVHTHSSKAGILGRMAAWAAGVPVIIHSFHGFGFHDYQKPLVRTSYAAIEKMIGWLTTHFIFVSRMNEAYAASWGIRARKGSTLIRSGVDLQRLRRLDQATRERKRTELGIPADSMVVSMIGNLKPQKNSKDFIELAKRLLNTQPHALFLFIGGTEKDCADQERLARSVPKNLRCLGWRADSAEILKASDVFVLTSLWEGLPRSLVEAMALGLPTSAYATDGIAELIDNAQNGILVAPKDIDALCLNLQRLLDDAALRARLGGKAQHAIGDEFDINTMVTEQERLYFKLLPAA